MKKSAVILSLTLALLFSNNLFAASATLEYGGTDNVNSSSAGQTFNSLTVRENINANFIGDVQYSQILKDGVGLSYTRAETALTPTYQVNQYFSVYNRIAVGENYHPTYNWAYWSSESGVRAPIGSTGLTASLAWRFRTAFNPANPDTTRTWKTGIAYDLTEKDTVGVRYDRTTGDFNQKSYVINYTRKF